MLYELNVMIGELISLPSILTRWCSSTTWWL